MDGARYVVWQLVDTGTGESVAAKRAEGAQLSGLADAVVAAVLPVLADRCGVETVPVPQSVTSLTTSNPKAHEYYVAGRLALDRYEIDQAIRLLESAVAQDTTFALASFDLAKAYRTQPIYGKARTSTEARLALGGPDSRSRTACGWKRGASSCCIDRSPPSTCIESCTHAGRTTERSSGSWPIS